MVLFSFQQLADVIRTGETYRPGRIGRRGRARNRKNIQGQEGGDKQAFHHDSLFLSTISGHHQGTGSRQATGSLPQRSWTLSPYAEQQGQEAEGV
jgi:hypothetical protein